jgi:hypothetical protein
LRSKLETDRANSEGLTRLPARSLACSSIRRRPSFNWADRWNSAWTGPRPHAAIARTRYHRSRAHAPRAAPSCTRVGARAIVAAPAPGAGASRWSRAVAAAPARARAPPRCRCRPAPARAPPRCRHRAGPSSRSPTTCSLRDLKLEAVHEEDANGRGGKTGPHRRATRG